MPQSWETGKYMLCSYSNNLIFITVRLKIRTSITTQAY